MNPTPVFGWYYYSSFHRSPSWSGVEFFFNFLINNKKLGPFAKIVSLQEVEIGDIVQLQFFGNDHFEHTVLITKILHTNNFVREKDIFVTANTDNVLNQNLSSYRYKKARFLKVIGVYI